MFSPDELSFINSLHASGASLEPIEEESLEVSFETSAERQCLIPSDSVIPVFRRSRLSPSSPLTPPSTPPSASPSNSENQDIVKSEMVRRIKRYLSTANLETVRPRDIHDFIRSQFSCYRENRDKYRQFVDDNILVCYGQMDEASLIIPGLYLGAFLRYN